MRRSALVYVCLTIACIGLFFHMLGVATNNWASFYGGGEYAHSGLWRYCSDGHCDSYGFVGDINFTSARVFSLLALFTGAACVVLIGVYMLIRDNCAIIRLSALSAFITTLCILIAIACFASYSATRYRRDLSWSFALCVVAMPFFLLDGALMALHVISDRRAGYEGTA